MKSKVLLVYLPGLEIGYGPIFPLGIGYLLAAIRQDRVAKAVHYQLMEHALQQLPEIISNFKPEIVGLTCSSFNRGNVRKVSQWLKSNYPDIKIILGGVHVSFFPEQAILNYKADYVVIGEGEITLRELCWAIDAEKSPNDVDGIAYSEGGRIVTTKTRTVIRDLDKLFIPDFSYAGDIMRESGLGFVITSRGCPAHCYFCSTGSFWGQKVRTNSPRRVVDEIEIMMQEYGVRKIMFHDDTFNVSINRVLDICDEILRRKLDIQWECVCRVHPVSEEMIDRMVESGCRHICWGIESGSKQMLERINKKITQEQIKKAYELCRKYIGTISVGAFTMVGNPGESNETIKETVDFLNTIPLTDSPAPSVLYILPGTDIYKDMQKKNPNIDKFWADNDGILSPPEFSNAQLSQWAKQVGQSGEMIGFDRTRHFLYDILFGNVPTIKLPTFTPITEPTLFQTPILFMVYRRPELTQLVFNEIKRIKPKYLYVAADGPQKGIVGEVAKCISVRDVISQIDWECDLQLLYQNVNLGGKWGGYTAISWFFNHVEEGIILEDDDIPDPSFFPYCTELLEKYRNDNRIGTISGDNFQFGQNKTSDSYYYSKYLHGWGWASWKRVWEQFDIALKDWPSVRNTDWIGELLDDPREIPFWTSTLDRMYEGDMGAWDYQFSHFLWRKRMLTVLPSINLVSNIGFGEDSTHCSGNNIMANVKREQMVFPLKHPTVLERNKKADIFTLRYYL